MGEATPKSKWLVLNNFPVDTDLATDLNGGGIPILMAYALNLDPKSRLSAHLPKAEMGEGRLKLSFYAESKGINYVVETSTNLKDWITE